MSAPDFERIILVTEVYADHGLLIEAQNQMTGQGATWIDVLHSDDGRKVIVRGWKVKPGEAI